MVGKTTLGSVWRAFTRLPGRARSDVPNTRRTTGVVVPQDVVVGTGRTAADGWQLFETLPQIVWIARADGWHTNFNARWTEFTGLTLAESLGFGWQAPFHPEDRELAARRWQQAIASGAPYEIEYRLKHVDGTYHWMLGRAVPSRDDAGQVVKWFGTCTDIDALKEAQAQLAQQARLLDLTHDALIVHDLACHILFWNEAAARIHGWSRDEAIGSRLGDLVLKVETQFEQAMNEVLRDGEWSGELDAIDRTGRALVLDCTWTLLHDDAGKPQAVLGVNTNITDRRQVEARLKASVHVQATRDALTGLANRASLQTRLDKALQGTGCGERGVVFILLDLDDFKFVNEALGHAAGDEVLCEVARRLRAALRGSDFVARSSGDEFAILLEDVDDQTVRALEERLFHIVPQPVVLASGQPVEVELSAGIVRATANHDTQTLFRDADAALYQAKRRGKGRAEHFDETTHVAVLERLAVPRQLRTALQDGGDELFCLYQPEVVLNSGELFGVEALVRWQHPERGLLTPDQFVLLAETSGLTGQLFDHVLQQVLATQRDWALSLGSSVAVSVNLSARDLGDTSLPDRVEQALCCTGMSADQLWLEVTESAIADPYAFATLQALHGVGVQLAIDDFGTGWSSLNRLVEMPFDMLKIDQSFTSMLLPGSKVASMVSATIDMAHALGLLTVAEGIETKQQCDMLTELGCDIGQGYFFARPLAAAEATRRVTWDLS